MSGLKNFLLELRYRPAMCALISVDAYMGIPWQLEGGILYIPFFKLADQNICLLESEIFVGYPAGTLYAYKKAGKDNSFAFHEKAFRKWKKDWIDSGRKNTRDDSIPADFTALYANAVLVREAEGWECVDHDKYTDGE